MTERLTAVLRDFWRQHQGKVIATVLSLVASLVGAVVNQEVRAPRNVEVPVEIVKEVIKEVPKLLDPNSPFSYPDGWVDDQQAVQAYIAANNPPVFADTDAGSVQDLPKAVYCWKFYESLPIRGPPAKNQGSVGSCVGHGTNRAIEHSLAAEIVSGHKAYEWARFAEEVTYANSRVDVGGGRIRGDGSVGAWAADAAVKLGMVPRDKYGDIDLSAYNEARCRQWGASGTPAAVKAVGKKYPVAQTSRITNWSDCKKALASGYATAVCSNVGFNNRNGSVGTRDQRGVILPNGQWNHCMAVDGYHTDTDGTEYAHITNSWGASAHAGPVGWGSPPPDGFWTPASVVDRMLRQGDSWAFSGVAGFPRRNLPDGFIRNIPVKRGDQNLPGLASLGRMRAQDMVVAIAR